MRGHRGISCPLVASRHLHPLEGVEEPLVLVLAIPIGHSRDVIADGAVRALLADPRLVGGRELPGVPLVLPADHGHEPLGPPLHLQDAVVPVDRKSTRLNSSHGYISYAV